MAIWDDVISAEEQRAYEKAGWGGRVGFGGHPGLLVVDMNTAFVDPEYPFSTEQGPAVSERIAELLAVFREAGLPVVFTTVARTSTTAERGRWKVKALTESPILKRPEAYEVWHELAPRDDEPVLSKVYPSAFFGTTLSSVFNYHGVDTVVVTGTVTSGCVRATCLDAFNLNYRVIVPEECVCDRGEVSHKVALFEINMKYGDVIPMAEVIEQVRARART